MATIVPINRPVPQELQQLLNEETTLDPTILKLWRCLPQWLRNHHLTTVWKFDVNPPPSFVGATCRHAIPVHLFRHKRSRACPVQPCPSYGTPYTQEPTLLKVAAVFKPFFTSVQEAPSVQGALNSLRDILTLRQPQQAPRPLKNLPIFTLHPCGHYVSRRYLAGSSMLSKTKPAPAKPDHLCPYSGCERNVSWYIFNPVATDLVQTLYGSAPPPPPPFFPHEQEEKENSSTRSWDHFGLKTLVPVEQEDLPTQIPESPQEHIYKIPTTKAPFSIMGQLRLLLSVSSWSEKPTDTWSFPRNNTGRLFTWRRELSESKGEYLTFSVTGKPDGSTVVECSFPMRSAYWIEGKYCTFAAFCLGDAGSRKALGLLLSEDHTDLIDPALDFYLLIAILETEDWASVWKMPTPQIEYDPNMIPIMPYGFLRLTSDFLSRGVREFHFSTRAAEGFLRFISALNITLRMDEKDEYFTLTCSTKNPLALLKEVNLTEADLYPIKKDPEEITFDSKASRKLLQQILGMQNVVFPLCARLLLEALLNVSKPISQLLPLNEREKNLLIRDRKPFQKMA